MASLEFHEVGTSLIDLLDGGCYVGKEGGDGEWVCHVLWDRLCCGVDFRG